MKAAVIREHGGPEVIRVEDLPDPTPRAGEVLLDVHAAGLNHLDLWVRKGGRSELAFPHVLGTDAAGVVEAVGDGVAGVSPGDEVLVYPGVCLRCPQCAEEDLLLCEDFGIVGLATQGVFADKAVLPARCVVPKPADWAFPEAAALVVAYLTAWRMLTTRANLRPGQTVLIHGIGGGVALAGLQIARLLGAEIVVTSSSNDKLSRARQLGAHHTLNYQLCGDPANALLETLDGRKVDVAFDSVGAATLPMDLDLVRRGGTIVNCGVTTGAQAELSIQKIYWNQLNVLGSTLGTHSELRAMLRAFEINNVKPVIDRMYPLAQIRDATERMDNGEQMGKIVLTMKS